MRKGGGGVMITIVLKEFLEQKGVQIAQRLSKGLIEQPLYTLLLNDNGVFTFVQFAFFQSTQKKMNHLPWFCQDRPSPKDSLKLLFYKECTVAFLGR